MGQDMVFFVTKSDRQSLLGFKSSQMLGLIKVTMSVNKNEKDTLIDKHKKVFQGLGCLQDTVN